MKSKTQKVPFAVLTAEEILTEYPCNIANRIKAECKKCLPKPGSVYEPDLGATHSEQMTVVALENFGAQGRLGGSSPVDVVHYPSNPSGKVVCVDVKSISRIGTRNGRDRAVTPIVLSGGGNVNQRASALQKARNMFQTYNNKLASLGDVQHRYINYINDKYLRKIFVHMIDVFPENLHVELIDSKDIVPTVSGFSGGVFIKSSHLVDSNYSLFCCFKRGRIELRLRVEGVKPENLIEVYSY